jgi:very-short-patch-repair endonuclease
MRRSQHPKLNAVLSERASAMRAVPTWSEALLFRHLNRSALGVRFIRQAPFGRFIVDLLAPSARLVVEVDGAWHRRRRSADARRDRKLRLLGFRVLRLEAGLVERDVAQAVELVRAALAAPP